MSEFIIDMGYEEFSKRPELEYSLAYAIADGLRAGGGKVLLCDFSDDARTYSAEDLLVISLALSERAGGWTTKARIGLVIPPSFAGAVCNYACVFAKKVPVNLNFTMGPVAAASCIETADLDCIATSVKTHGKISHANPKFPWTEKLINIEDEIAQIAPERLEEIRRGVRGDFENFLASFGVEKSSDNSREGTLVFTSGSEGAPKAAILTQKNIIANCVQTLISRVFAEDDVLLSNMPIFHSFGALFEIWYMAIAGQHIVTLISPLDIKSNIRAIRETKATVMIGSPTFFRAYIKHASKEDLATLRMAIAGAEKTPEGFHKLWNDTFNPDSYREGYGLTETTPVVGVNLSEKDYGYYSTGSRAGSIGKLFPGMQARVVDASTLKPLKFGESGLLSMRGPNVFAGYLNMPEATEKVFDGDWLVTGDISRLDADGFLYIDGRLSRFSKIGGEMVPHATVENALNSQLGFTGADIPVLAVSSRLDEAKGEALVLISTLDLSMHEVKDALRAAGISNLWLPKHIVRAEKIPLLPSGKLDLAALAALARE